jgi:hypothetical protein
VHCREWRRDKSQYEQGKAAAMAMSALIRRSQGPPMVPEIGASTGFRKPDFPKPLLNPIGQCFVAFGCLKKGRTRYRLQGKFGLRSHFVSPIPPTLCRQ